MADQVRASHILVPSEQACNDLKSKIESGSLSFEDAAKQHSTCPSKARGGDLGFFGRGQMVKPFEEAAFNAADDQVVGPVQTQFGYHLIKKTGSK